MSFEDEETKTIISIWWIQSSLVNDLALCIYLCLTLESISHYSSLVDIDAMFTLEVTSTSSLSSISHSNPIGCDLSVEVYLCVVSVFLFLLGMTCKYPLSIWVSRQAQKRTSVPHTMSLRTSTCAIAIAQLASIKKKFLKILCLKEKKSVGRLLSLFFILGVSLD